jgi:urea transport system substrate-binding protein
MGFHRDRQPFNGDETPRKPTAGYIHIVATGGSAMRRAVFGITGFLAGVVVAACGQAETSQTQTTSASPSAPGTAAPAKRDTGPIKVGILHSLSGTMAISETSLKDAALMTIDEINAAGGVLGRKLEPVVVDPASNWPLFAEKARELLTKEQVAVVFGCWTSVSRKSVLPVFEELDGLLFYPVQYEGEEASYNVFYTGAAPNQQAIPAVEYLMGDKGGGAKRFVLLGTDYVYPRTTNKILRYFLTAKGIPESAILEEYTPFGHTDYQTIVARIKEFAGGGPTAVISTINGDSNVPFYKELANQGIKAADIPVIAFSVGEEELRGIDAAPLVGHLAAWNYFMSVDSPANASFKAMWASYAKDKGLPDADKRVTNDPMEATYVGIHMWAQAVEQAGTTEVAAVRQAVGGQTFAAPSGFTVTMDGKNHHLHKPVMIGEIQADGQFQIVWRTDGPIRAEPWSKYVPESATKVADWSYPWLCGNCSEPKIKVAPTAVSAVAPAAVPAN